MVATSRRPITRCRSCRAGVTRAPRRPPPVPRFRQWIRSGVAISVTDPGGRAVPRIPNPPPIAAATVAVVGLGGLGGPAAAQLAAIGVGCLRLIDDDVVDLSNLHRQLLYSEIDLGKPKAD